MVSRFMFIVQDCRVPTVQAEVGPKVSAVRQWEVFSPQVKHCSHLGVACLGRALLVGSKGNKKENTPIYQRIIKQADA